MTGEARFHDYLESQAIGLALVLPGHYATERLGAEVLADRLRAGFPGIERDFTAAVRSVVRTVGYPHGRAYRRRIGTVTCPVLLIHGTEDRLVPVAAARAAAHANPAWSLREFPGVGHVPQLEVPRQTADARGAVSASMMRVLGPRARGWCCARAPR